MMLMTVVGPLPDVHDGTEADWVRWQVGAVTQLIYDIVHKPQYCLLYGCEGEREGEWRSSPEDHLRPDSLGVFCYDEGYAADEEANEWGGIASVIFPRFCKAIDWQHVRPATLRACAERMGLAPVCRYVPRPEPKGVPRTDAEVIEIEDSKNDENDIELGRFPKWPNELDTWSYVHLIRLYIDFVCGDPPPGVRVALLWRASEKYKSGLTDTWCKVVAGWGLSMDDGAEPAALEYAELFRLAFYHFVGAVDWEELKIETIKQEIGQLGLSWWEEEGS